jgi:hypothetical protein
MCGPFNDSLSTNRTTQYKYSQRSAVNVASLCLFIAINPIQYPIQHNTIKQLVPLLD